MNDDAFFRNSIASFNDLLDNGPPSQPLQFSEPVTGFAERVDSIVLNPVTQETQVVSNIIYEKHPDNRPPQHAYLIGRKLRRSIFGVVKECTVLRPRNNIEVPWEMTSEKATVKMISWERINQLEHEVDPVREVAAMQYVTNTVGRHPHVMAVLDVLQDEDYLLVFMPFCASGDLFQLVERAGRFPEPLARYCFRQLLQGLTHLQRSGVCLRNMSLENILVDEDKSVLFELGMCLKVPYSNEVTGNVCDVSQGTLRRLIVPLEPVGKPNYISPEVLRSEEPFDGFAIDLWATAVILFIMLVGLPPWEYARQEDPRYLLVVRGGLESMLQNWNRTVSPSAADLLQKMFREDPRERLSIHQILDHPWVVSEDVIDINTIRTHSWHREE